MRRVILENIFNRLSTIEGTLHAYNSRNIKIIFQT